MLTQPLSLLFDRNGPVTSLSWKQSIMNAEINNPNNTIDKGSSQFGIKVETNGNDSGTKLNIMERLNVIKTITDKDKKESMINKLIGEMIWDLVKTIEIFKEKLLDNCVDILRQEIEHFYAKFVQQNTKINDNTNDDNAIE